MFTLIFYHRYYSQFHIRNIQWSICGQTVLQGGSGKYCNNMHVADYNDNITRWGLRSILCVAKRTSELKCDAEQNTNQRAGDPMIVTEEEKIYEDDEVDRWESLIQDTGHRTNIPVFSGYWRIPCPGISLHHIDVDKSLYQMMTLKLTRVAHLVSKFTINSHCCCCCWPKRPVVSLENT